MRCEQHGRVLWMVILAAYFIDTTLSLHHKLTKRELQQVFGVEDKEKVPEYHLILTERTTEDGFLRIRFRAWNQTFEAELNPNRKLVSRDIVTVVRDNDNVEESSKGLPYENQCHFLGKVVSHDDAPIAISDCQTLMGTVVLPDHFLVLQTLPNRVQHHQAEKHVVYKREAGLNPLERIIEEHLITQNVVHDDFCDTTDLFSLNYTVPPAGQLDSPFIFPQLDPITLEIGLFLDSKLYEHFKREYIQDAEQHLLEFSLALINNVHVLYQQPTLSPNLDIVIVRYELWKTQPSNLATIVHKNGQAQSLLDAFCRHQARVNPGSDLTDNSHWDHAVLLTGYDIYHTTASVAGVAPVARMCDPLFACSLVEGLHLGRSFVLAHEMGHNMGMVHDGVQNQCSRSCCLMSAVNGAGKTRWSECSVREFNAFLMQLDETGQGNCLRDSNSGVHTHNHLTDGRLPGQRFTADQQCGYFWGRDYQVEIPTGRQMDDICRILWCGNKGSTISTAHPALEGSWCGQDKWCIDGKCRAWPYGLSPLEIDGGWSEWSQVDKRCPVQQCHITGSIPIRAQHRDCVNPAPNNGGRECEGSSIRGLLCHSAHSTCKGLSREEFSNKVCSSIKYDPNKPDRQLTGTSFMHDTQPCKVWCHLIDSELIRNKGSFPDGSPCGNGLYCIGGSCLALSCRDSALVESEEDCPENKNAHWLEWSSWSHCSRSCGKGGTQRRWRKCSSTHKDVHCLGSAEDYRTCINQPPPCDQTFENIVAAAGKTHRKRRVSQWSPWSPCSKKCGSGIQIRTRECLDVDCEEQLTQKRICSNGDCYSQWTEWTSCSASCGGGTRSRTRTCGIENCDEALEERDLCNKQRCVVETWGDWLPCSVSCGVGFQIRERICDGVLCPGGNKQARTCNEQPCIAASDESSANDEWSEWTTCSETCGEGSQVRTRSCTGHTCPSGFLTERRRCVMGPCPEWSDWSDWSSCPSCQSSLKRTRTRSCSSIHNDGTSCEGDSIEEDTCANSCDSTNTNTNDLDEQPVWREWSEWSSCSATCGGGRKTRSKLCLSGPCESPLVLEKQLCNSQDCVGVRDFLWSNWSEWTECSATCGEGNRRRSRRCRAIFSFGCDGDSEQTEQCTVTCNKRRKKETSEPEWSAWSDWSSCSCFTLTETRRRYCQIVDPIAQGFCSGPILEQRKCSPKLCAATNGGWSSWSEWSACSKDCQGTGHQIRNRMCSNPLPSNKGLYCVGYSFDQRACTSNSPCGAKVDGGWSEWMEWSECSSPCNNGHRSRTRYCSNPRPASGGLQCFGSDFELQPCSDKETCSTSAAVAGHWSQWSAWTDCPKKCGLAVQSRQRVCELPKDASPQSNVYCEGLAYITSVCPSTACPQSVDGGWGPWSAWSQCTFNCGTGSTTRVRECVSPAPMNGGLPCFGRSSEEEECPASDDFCSATIANSKLIDVEFIAASQ